MRNPSNLTEQEWEDFPFLKPTRTERRIALGLLVFILAFWAVVAVVAIHFTVKWW